MAIEITYETIIILSIFVAVVFILYRLFKMALRAALVGIASFSFPWVVKFLSLDLPITANVGIQFALLGIALFFIYESAHTIVKVLKIITWPIRHLLKGGK